MSLRYFGGNDLVHALSEEEGAEIGYPRRSRKAGKARGSAEQRPAVTGELAKSSLRARLCSKSVYRPIAIGLQAARRVRVVPGPEVCTIIHHLDHAHSPVTVLGKREVGGARRVTGEP